MSESAHSAKIMRQHSFPLRLVLGAGHDLAQLEADIAARITGNAPLLVGCATTVDAKRCTNYRDLAFHDAAHYTTNGTAMGDDGRTLATIKKV